MSKARQSGGGSVFGSPTSLTHELAELREALARAETEAAAAASESKRVEAEVRHELDALLTEVDLTPESWRDAQAVGLARSEGAEAAASFAGRRVLGLRGRAANISEQIAAERIAKAEAALRAATVAVAAAEEEFDLARAARDRAAITLEDVQDEALDVRAEFDPEAARSRDDRARQEREQIRWFAENPLAVDQVPRRLRAAVELERERLDREAVEGRARMAEEARESRLRAEYSE